MTAPSPGQADAHIGDQAQQTAPAGPATGDGLPDGLPFKQRLQALAVIVLGLVVSVLDASVVNLALPPIMRDLNASAAGSIWILNAYQLATLGLLLPLANLGDRLGHHRVYLFGMAIFTLASLACGLAQTLPQLAAARALQGVGAAGIMSVTAALMRLIYPRRLLGRGLAINSMVVAASTVAGPTVAAAILSFATWHWLFLVNIPLGLLTLWLGWRSLPHSPPATHRTEWTLLDAALNVLVFSLVFLGADGLGTHLDAAPGMSHNSGVGYSAQGLLLPALQLLAGLLLGVWYVQRQRRMTRPLLPLDLLRMPVFALSMCASVGAFCAQMIAFAGLPFLLLEVQGRTPLQAGALLTAWPLAIVVAAPLVGRVIGKVPGAWLGAAGMSLLATGLTLLALLPPHASDTMVVAWLLLCGAGFGIFQSPNNHIILTTAPAQRAGAAGGMLGTARLTGQTLGAVVLATVFSFYPLSTPGGGVASSDTAFGFTLALGLAAVFALASGTASLLRQPPRAATPSSPTTNP
ncbi:multidrug MFS transporter [Hylemonella gracilis str. Niagara R]|uniref:Multidrug MFS transporter n=1 Tax=Hylemonella gracilis str. Niagara R TaxID=1458275 RepID=A0A016XIU6_9BURK|nr:MFS transporter [Hylemonella gracilis]EYC51113.1 multidrug MFS transporter [Hylemonella gracilis str. Niagara R]